VVRSGPRSAGIGSIRRCLRDPARGSRRRTGQPFDVVITANVEPWLAMRALRSVMIVSMGM
jgi:hypothetical protein